ncbi:predicted protein [Histoplasma capsulatum G186AR]|uniref:Uncharacterized protein n=1 Tax=Ajellomyces capsulatus (strain G186AR / H82 / ATCC MYA-2454 / RMSCC 2432) TaxID=447093 RepID=C0NG08_AJECG|nr:uncharacterized protein HCBG_01824 [Histoplasma capsulatum G186AR]EEH10179.1 predicted protein [Histoplasma capsulatum G186AR]
MGGGRWIYGCPQVLLLTSEMICGYGASPRRMEVPAARLWRFLIEPLHEPGHLRPSKNFPVVYQFVFILRLVKTSIDIYLLATTMEIRRMRVGRSFPNPKFGDPLYEMTRQGA